MAHITSAQRKELNKIMGYATMNDNGMYPYSQPYIAPVMFMLYPVAVDVEKNPDMATLAVDKYWRLYINFDYFDSLTDIQKVAVLQHECWHVLHGHHKIQEDYMLNPQFSNYVGDFQINGPLREFLPEGCLLPEDYDMENNKDFWYYAIQLKKQMEDSTCPSCGKSNGSKDSSNESDDDQDDSGSGEQDSDNGQNGNQGKDSDQEGNEEGQNDGSKSNGHGKKGSFLCPDCSNTCSGGSGAGGTAGSWELPEGEAPTVDKVEQDIQRHRAAVSYSQWRRDKELRGQGLGAADFSEWLDDIFGRNIVNWRTELKNLTARMGKLAGAGPKPIYSRMNRRRGMKGQLGSKEIPGRRVFTPATRNILPQVTVAIDTSGSMSIDDLTAAVIELMAIVKQVGPVKYFCVDSEVKEESVKTYNGSGGKVEIIGGGGTDMSVAVDYADSINSEVLVLVTDGYTEWNCAKPAFTQVIVAIVGDNPKEIVNL